MRKMHVHCLKFQDPINFTTNIFEDIFSLPLNPAGEVIEYCVDVLFLELERWRGQE